MSDSEPGTRSRWHSACSSIGYVVGNVGRRWLVRNNVNITARIGAGLVYRTYNEPFGEPEDITPVRYLDDLLDQFPITVDGELSVGYTF